MDASQLQLAQFEAWQKFMANELLTKNLRENNTSSQPKAMLPTSLPSGKLSSSTSKEASSRQKRNRNEDSDSSTSQSWDESPQPKSVRKEKKEGVAQALKTKESRKKIHQDKIKKKPRHSAKRPSTISKSQPVTAATKSSAGKAITVTSRYPKTQIHVREQLEEEFDNITLPDLDDGNDPKRFVVGVDYGTTFTSVSYYCHSANDDHPQAFPDDVEVIMNWPEDSMGGARRQIPTESWYSSVPKHRPVVHDQFEPSDSEEDDGQEQIKSASTNQMESSYTDNIYAEINCEESDKFLWGYQALYQQFAADPARDEVRHIARPKLMLVSSEYTRADRERLRPQLDSLISGGFIRKFKHKKTQDPRDVQDVITDFMIEVFKHTKLQLTENAGYTPACPVSFVLTVPVIWCPRSSRVLQYAVEAAIGATGFGTLNHGSVDNIFIINEPEAAATFLLGKSNDMLAGEALVVLDCGGGTVDCVTYTITNSYPLRLKTEVGKPTGDNCGASYLNDNFEKHLLKRLANETYLEQDGESLEEIVRRLVPAFEDRDKRRQDVIIGRPYNTIYIKGLRSNKEKRFKNQHVELNHYDYNEIFMPLLRRVGKVLRGQIEMATSKGKDVKKVCLIGGFGACPSLRSYLGNNLKETMIELKLPRDIVLETTSDQKSLTAVSSGAVLRALNKDGGPERIAFCSYGFLRVQPYEPDFEGHKAAESWIDPLDEKEYVEVIDYFMLKGDTIDSVQRYDPITISHAFAVDRDLRCEEVLYVSDLPTKSDFPLDHPLNKDAHEAGRIVTDFSFLRKEGKIHPIRAKQDKEGNIQGQDHYEVEYDLVVIVEGRNLKYEARYPAGGKGKVQMVKQISIAAAFLPGTD